MMTDLKTIKIDRDVADMLKIEVANAQSNSEDRQTYSTVIKALIEFRRNHKQQRKRSNKFRREK